MTPDPNPRDIVPTLQVSLGLLTAPPDGFTRGEPLTLATVAPLIEQLREKQ